MQHVQMPHLKVILPQRVCSFKDGRIYCDCSRKNCQTTVVQVNGVVVGLFHKMVGDSQHCTVQLSQARLFMCLKALVNSQTNVV